MSFKMKNKNILLVILFYLGFVVESKADYWIDAVNVLSISTSFQINSAITTCENLQVKCWGAMHNNCTLDSTTFTITGNNIYTHYYFTGQVCNSSVCGCLGNYTPLSDTLILPLLSAGIYQVHFINHIQYFSGAVNNIILDTVSTSNLLVDGTILNSPSVALNSSSYVSAATTTLCDNQPVVITATNLYTGINPMYFWYKNSILIDSGISKIEISKPTGFFQNGDVVECQVHTSANSCLLNSIGIAQIALAIHPSPTIAIQITPTNPNFCYGKLDTFYVNTVGVADSLWFSYNNVSYYLWQNPSVQDTIIAYPYSYGASMGLFIGGHAKNANGCINNFNQTLYATNTAMGILHINSDYLGMDSAGDTISYFIDNTNIDTSGIVEWYFNSALVSTMNIKDTFKHTLVVGNNNISSKCYSTIGCITNNPTMSNIITNMGNIPAYINNFNVSDLGQVVACNPYDIVLSNFKGNESWRLIDIHGAILKKGILTQHSSTISISSLSNGIYILDIGSSKYKISVYH